VNKIKDVQAKLEKGTNEYDTSKKNMLSFLKQYLNEVPYQLLEPSCK